MEIYIKAWDDLTPMQKEMAIDNYAAIRECEEGDSCSRERAKLSAPHCCGYWVDESGCVTCNI